MTKFINQKAIFEKWAPVIQKSTSITDKERLTWMSLLAQNQRLNEDVYNNPHVNPNMNINGMGAVTFPGNPGLSTDFRTQTPGSGDKPYSLLPLAMQVAAQTIGLDLVPVIPMPGPMGMLTYLDYVYAGGKLDSKEAPLIIKVPVELTSGVTLVEGTKYYAIEGGNCYYIFQYIGKSRIDGYPTFKVIPTDTNGTSRGIGAVGIKTINEIVTGGDLQDAATAGSVVAVFDGDAELVKALEDHIPGFSTRGMRLNDTNPNSEEAYKREEGESEPESLMGLTMRTQSVSAQTIQVAAAVTREQIDDLRQYNIDAMGQLEAILSNELTQTINKMILSRMFRMGATSHARWFENDGENFNVNINSTDANLYIGQDVADNAVIMNTRHVNTTLGEVGVGSIQRQILSYILGAANAINNHTRRGSGNFIVTNHQIVSAIQSIAGYTAYPLSNTISQNAGSLYNVGSIAGIQVYMDPNMKWSDTRIVVGRKGDSNSTGLVFMPYLMAQSTSIIAQSTMSPKVAIKSRFALVEAGHYPEDNYMTLKVNVGDVLNSVLG